MKTAPLCALSLAALAAPASSFQDAVLGLLDPREPSSKAAVEPFSLADGLDLSASVPAVVLGPLDMAALARADALQSAKTLRYGVARPLLVTGRDGTWHGLSDGRLLWTVDIVSEGALGLRLSIADLDLPPGAELVAYGVDDPSHVAGPYVGRGPFGDGRFFTPTSGGDHARLEVVFPVQKPDDPTPFTDRLPLLVDGLQHVYRDPTGSSASPGEDETGRDPRFGAGPCHNDVSCYPAWSSTANAVAGIGWVDGDSLFCTGELLNATNGDLTPYFLTANHCISTAAAAQTAEVYWLYQTPSCGGAPPPLPSVPQSAVCTLLSTGTASDHTLLMVEGTLPPGLAWAGWTSAPVSDGTEVACVHHPAGDYKRISFGTKSSTLSCGGRDHVRVDWTDGPTEPGSSGAGVFRADTQQLFGQLHCGTSSCGNETNDQFGAFASTYPYVAALLAGGSDDGLEDCDTCAQAAPLAPGSYASLLVKSTDEDWYRITVPGGGYLQVDLAFTHAFGDVDAELYTSCGTGPVASSTGTSDAESIIWSNPGAAADVLLRVFLADDTRNGYDLVVFAGAGPPNDSCASALDVDAGTYYGSLETATNDGSASCGSSSSNADVWYRYSAPAAGTLTVTTCGSHDLPGIDQGTDTVLSLHAGCPGTSGNELVCNDDAVGGVCGSADQGVGRDSSVSRTVAAGEVVLVRVSCWGPTSPGAFVLNVDGPSGTPPANDACSAAEPLGIGQVAGTLAGATGDGAATCGTSSGNADVWYAFVAPSSGTLDLSTCGTNDLPGVDLGTDTVLSVHSACPGTTGNELACNDDAMPACAGDSGATRDSALAVTLAAGEMVLVRVSHWGSSTPGAFLLQASFASSEPGSAACFGSGCPCGNDDAAPPDAGCANSTGGSARLSASGSPSVAADDLVLTTTGAPPGNTGLYFVGGSLFPAVFVGDGLACTGGIYRYTPGVVDGAGTFVLTSPVASAVPGAIQPGDTRHFQAWTRDVLCGPPPAPCASPCGQNSNLSNAYSVTFQP